MVVTIESEELKSSDGGWAWVICFASFTCQAIFGGVCYTFGVIYVELLDFFQRSKADTALIVSIYYVVSYMLGPLYSFITGRLGCRLASSVGSIIFAVGLSISLWTPNLYFLYFSIGIIGGAGCGLVYFVSIVAVSQHFDKHRSLATGIATSGIGLGTFLMGPVLTVLVENYTWKGAILIEGAIALNCLVCSLLYRPVQDVKRSNLKHHRNKQLKVRYVNSCIATNKCNSPSRVDEVVLVNKEMEISDRKLGTDHGSQCELDKNEADPFISNNNGSSTNMADTEISDNIIYSHSEDNSEISQRDSLTNKIKISDAKCSSANNESENMSKKDVYIALAKNLRFVMLWVSVFFSWLSFFIPYGYIMDTARTFNIETSRSAWVISAMGVASTVGRLVCGMLGGMRCLNSRQVYITTLIVCGASVIAIPFSHLFEPLISLSIVFAFLSGGTVPLAINLMIDAVGMTLKDDAVGFYILACGLGICLGAPFAGWLFDMTGTYLATYLFSGICYISAGIIVMLMYLVT